MSSVDMIDELFWLRLFYDDPVKNPPQYLVIHRREKLHKVTLQHVPVASGK
jgi:hypothetical protein